MVPMHRGVHRVGALERHTVLHGVAAVASVSHLDGFGSYSPDVQTQLVAAAAAIVAKCITGLQQEPLRCEEGTRI